MARLSQEEVDKDLDFNLEDGSDKLMKMASLRVKYTRHLMYYQGISNDLELDRKKEFGIKWRHYSMNDNQVIDRRDIVTYIETDNAYQNILRKINKNKERITYIDGILKALDNISFQINAAVKWHIFQNGG